MHNLIQLEHIKQRKEQLNGYYQNNREKINEAGYSDMRADL